MRESRGQRKMSYAAAWIASYIVMIVIGLIIYGVARIGSHVPESIGWVIVAPLAALAAALVISDLAGKRRKRKAR